jgi:hypothetical protein
VMMVMMMIIIIGSFMQLPHVLLEVKVPTKSFPTSLTSEGLLVIVRVHVESKIVDLVESLVADGTLESLFPTVGQLVIFIIPFLMKSFATVLANEGLVPIVYPYMRV